MFKDGVWSSETRSSSPYVSALLDGVSTLKMIAGLAATLLFFAIFVPILISVFKRCALCEGKAQTDQEVLVEEEPGEEEVANDSEEVESV